MFTTDLLIYPTHLAFWASFGLTRRLTRGASSAEAQADVPAPAATRSETAPFSRFVLGVHMLAFAVMYAGVGDAAFGNHVPDRFHGQRIIGTLVIALGAALMCWAVASFHSWRFRAKLDAGHQLATGGPFKLMRHPIYMGLNLLALGTAIWIPTATVWSAVLLMVIGSDLRARSEESVLTKVFGRAYGEYRTRTRRFVPGLY